MLVLALHNVRKVVVRNKDALDRLPCLLQLCYALRTGQARAISCEACCGSSPPMDYRMLLEHRLVTPSYTISGLRVRMQ